MEEYAWAMEQEEEDETAAVEEEEEEEQSTLHIAAADAVFSFFGK